MPVNTSLRTRSHRLQSSECKGKSICEHGRRRRRVCKERRGDGICEHARARYTCKECRSAGGSDHCAVRAVRADPGVGGRGICEHGPIWMQGVRGTRGAYAAEHGRVRYGCKECKEGG
eukprot:753835-Hanusia_phi.AAC.2